MYKNFLYRTDHAIRYKKHSRIASTTVVRRTVVTDSQRVEPEYTIVIVKSRLNFLSRGRFIHHRRRVLRKFRRHFIYKTIRLVFRNF